MDIASASIGFFTTAFKAYQKITKAIDVNSKRPKWSVLMRIERARFEAWGLVLGFLDAETGNPKNEGTIKSEVVAELNDILQVEKIGGLVQEVLKSITCELQEFDKSAKKYRLVVPDAENSSPKPEAIRKLVDQSKDFSKHLAMMFNDEKMVDDLLNTLKALNDGLENVLSLPQRTRVQKALLSGVLPEYQTTAELDSFLKVLDRRSVVAGSVNTGMTYLEQYPALLATAKVKYRCVQMEFPDFSPFSAHDLRPSSDSEIPVKNLRIINVPTRAATDLLWPSGIVVFDSDNNQKFHVLVEWRQPVPTTFGIGVSEWQLAERRKELVQLLHETSNAPNAADYRVLDCLGYCRSTGRVQEEDQPTPIIGLVSKIPDWADGRKQPVPLYELLKDSFESNDPRLRPSLSARFQLARQLATALYQLQCSQWLHRNLSSHHVVFFYDKTTGTLRFEEPFLIGLQYSRPDDQWYMDLEAPGIRGGESEGMPLVNELYKGSLYVHPDFSVKPRRYRRSDDIYSIGIILSEIAFWEPVDVFHKDYEGIYSIARRVVEAARTVLSGHVGDIYRDAVVHCLEGLRQDVPKQRRKRKQEEVEEEEEETYTGKYSGEDPEIGLEADFLRMVLNEIAKCRV
ncbi:prion-inhibition and propagation-domain-containing protein [Xylaria cubensis]|nr:prion-inhibition and propagation-domain-containing protein [Xylaria cubensis]